MSSGCWTCSLSRGLETRQREYVSVAQSSAESLLTIIDDILDFSKIEAGKLSLESIPFDVAAITEDVTALYLPQATGKGLELRCRVSPDLPRLVQGDPTRVRQVLSNLVGNAVKFTETGQIEVRLSAAAGDGDTARLTFNVEDTGIGMPASTLNRLFTSFAQGDASTTRRFGGTGLGLAICHELVTMMGGTIAAVSTDGVGTTFTVELRVRC
ncbi:sensor histidine kinase [Methanothrix soehngenii]|uniref:sensor histidine kinase n=1 Tax=Methanothrix soehngenii TaxID=2223 RepID=UPI00300CF469